jgi:apolipoprotein N-acyltransferase
MTDFVTGTMTDFVVWRTFDTKTFSPDASYISAKLPTMRSPKFRDLIPSWKSTLLAILSAVLLILSFPDFEFWFLAWFALAPLMWAVEKQRHCVTACFSLGWIFGTIFFFGSCWWLTFAPITYAGFPPVLAYFLLFIVTAITGLFPAAFATILAILLRRFGSWAFLAAPFVWVATEFARYWITGNVWNGLAYSQALASTHDPSFASLLSGAAVDFARLGGTFLVSFLGLIPSSVFAVLLISRTKKTVIVSITIATCGFLAFLISVLGNINGESVGPDHVARIVAIQPNVPMSGLDSRRWEQLRERQIEFAKVEMQKLRDGSFKLPTIVILPESPMNFMYNDDRDFQKFIGDFARENNVSVLFNSAEPDPTNGKYFNSAVLVGPDGRKAEQYDKIYLLPFGEAVPLPLQNILPAFVGSFSYGSEYDLVPLGNAKAGIMICFESHFGELSREYVRNGADAIIEMTNDGYLGPTPVLRQHLANAVFRAVETNRPVLRVTNVGITAYITETGSIIDPLPSYSEGTRVWTVSKSDGSQTFYVKYGDWFAWLCAAVTLGLIGFSFRKRRQASTAPI